MKSVNKPSEGEYGSLYPGVYIFSQCVCVCLCVCLCVQGCLWVCLIKKCERRCLNASWVCVCVCVSVMGDITCLYIYFQTELFHPHLPTYPLENFTADVYRHHDNCYSQYFNKHTSMSNVLNATLTTTSIPSKTYTSITENTTANATLVTKKTYMTSVVILCTACTNTTNIITTNGQLWLEHRF